MADNTWTCQYCGQVIPSDEKGWAQGHACAKGTAILNNQRIERLEQAVDAISARLADVQQHPALSIPALPGFE